MGDGQAQRNYVTDSMTRTHHDIETMTRKLELEKRRLQRIEKEHAAAKRTYQIRVLGTDISRSARRGQSGSEICDTETKPQSDRQNADSIGESAVASDAIVATGAGGSTSSRISTALAGPVRALVNRLDVQRKKLDSMNHDNLAMREEVDCIRRRRLQLNSIFERLKIDIRQRSAQLADFVEETASSRNVHGDAKQRVDVMKRHREQERRQFKQEVLRLREQLKLQDWERKEVEVQLKRADTGVQKKKELIIPEEETNFSEGEMMRRIMKTAFLNCIQRKHIKEHQKNIEVFEQAFSTIKQSTGIEHIEEIVKIFVNLENRNFSLLTYVNVMNREIEALEGIQRERRQTEEAREKHEEDHGHARQKALADLNQQLEASSLSNQELHEVTAQHRQLIQDLIPILMEIAQRIEREFDHLRTTGTSTVEDMLKLPAHLNEDTVPEWLELIASAVGRFRELLPGNAATQDWAFPSTAMNSVKTLPPKRFGHQAQSHQLVKQQELPSAFGLVTDEQGNRIEKRAHGQMTISQKAEIMDDESEDEDFDNRPLPLKELRNRALKSQANRRMRRQGHAATRQHALAERIQPRLGRKGSKDCSPSSVADIAKSSFGASGRPPRQNSAGEVTSSEKDDDIMEDDATTELGIDKITPALLSGAGDQGAFATPLPRKLGRGKLACQTVDGVVPAVSEEELDRCFLSRYKMTREELQVMADHMGIHMDNLCFLKQEFDQCDQDQSGYIDSRELKTLLKKLGEDLSDDALEAAVKHLDTDGSGEIEFFEFIEWFTSGE